MGRFVERCCRELIRALHALDAPRAIKCAISKYPTLIRNLYLNFANTYYVQTRGDHDDFIPTLSYLRLNVDEVLDDNTLTSMISKTVDNEHDEMVMSAFRVFNSAVQKTNFYTPTKVALSFRLNPRFLPEQEYPQPLYGMFLVISSEFRAFHSSTKCGLAVR